MKYVGRELKGTYGYIRKQLTFEIVKTVIMFAMAFGLFFIGYFTLHTKKSLWSVLAVLALLPSSRSLVGVIMLARFSSLSPEEFNRYSNVLGNIPKLYENILTTKDTSYFLPVICCASGCVTAYSPKGAEKDIREHLESVMNAAGHKMNVKVFTDEEAFLKRAAQMKEKLSDSDIAAAGPVLTTIKAVSL